MGYLDELRAISEKEAGRLPTKPTEPGSVSLVSASSGAFQKDASRVLREWCSAIEALDPCQPRPGFTMNRWQKLFDASVWFVETFGRQAAMDGWTTSDLFGLVRQVEGAGGLMDQLGDHRGLVMSADEARWRYLGQVPQLYRRGQWPNLEPFWSIQL